MQILEHQNIHLDNLISYTTKVKRSDILKLTQYISDNLHVLDLKKNDNIIFAEKEFINDETLNIEVLIPVKGKIQECKVYNYKPIFKLNNALMIRHEGSIDTISKTRTILYKFIEEHGFKPSSEPYYIVIRNDNFHIDDCITDICIDIE